MLAKSLFLPVTRGFFSPLLNKRFISTKILKEQASGTFIASIKNDGKENENKGIYKKRSFAELKNLLRSNTYHIYVDKFYYRNQEGGLIYPGHISGFLTNENKEVIEDSFISLRPGNLKPEEYLDYRLPSDTSTEKRKHAVWEVEFNRFEEEFMEHLFKYQPNTKKDRDRFIIGVPFSIISQKNGYNKDYLINLAKTTKEELKHKHNNRFIICSGELKDLNHKLIKAVDEAVNCVAAFYSAHGLKGIEVDPSPQMAAWSFLSFILGIKSKNELLDGTEFTDGVKRKNDDILSPKK